MQFASDNWAGVAEPVMTALARANQGLAPAYGGDPLTRAVEQRFAEVFDHEVAVFMVGTGGAANCLRMAPPLTVSDDEIDLAAEILDSSLTAVASAAHA